MKKPRIALTPRMSNDNLRQGDNTEYLEAILNNGGIPYILAVGTDPASVLEDFDGLLVTGGEDLDPSFYQESADYPIETSWIELDRFELALIHAFDQAEKPIFGICRGIQSINVAFGGTLYQDLASQRKEINALLHQQHKQIPMPSRQATVHAIHVFPNSILSTILPAFCEVNSYHHQSIKQLASGFQITAVSEDGIIEAIEKGERIQAVQWHPERLQHRPEQKALIARFIQTCNQKQ